MALRCPGLDPYLEHPDLWLEVHYRLISAIAIAIAAYYQTRLDIDIYEDF